MDYEFSLIQLLKINNTKVNRAVKGILGISRYGEYYGDIKRAKES
jgi:hypothetical protein